MALIDFCKENFIELVALYSNAPTQRKFCSRWMQPFFIHLRNHGRRLFTHLGFITLGLPLERDNFCPILKETQHPENGATTSKCQKRKSKEKTPVVATSGEWREYFAKKENEKADKIRKIEENKRKREEKKEAQKASKGINKNYKKNKITVTDSVTS
ncbi:hypothetical protein QE152_g29543 [Popillia japonica]|uniref:Uncharacterized protein n=1 Tax=Popillia japonica TaxID=7064 RepID=A0AAW1JGN7_POPJA